MLCESRPGTSRTNAGPAGRLGVVAQPLPLGALVVEALHVLRQGDAGLVCDLAEFSQLEAGAPKTKSPGGYERHA